MEGVCVFTRQVEPETYKHVSEQEIRTRFREIVETYLDACPKASLVSIEDVYLEATDDTITPQPFLEAIVFCEDSPEANLVENDVSMIGDASYFEKDMFPVRLLGSSYWVDESLAPSVEVQEREEAEQTESPDNRLVEFVYSFIRRR